MVQIIAGEKGKGKTKHLLDMVNHSIQKVSGNIVYLDKSPKHMYELNTRVRLINLSDYPVTNSDEFVGFICGILSQDKDVEEMYFDSFLTISKVDDSDLGAVIDKLDAVSEQFHVTFILSVSKNEVDLPECTKSKIHISL